MNTASHDSSALMSTEADPEALLAEALDRGWYLSGQLDQVPNLQWMGYVVLCPVWFASPAGGAPRLGWTVLRAEEDELLADTDTALGTPLRALDQALRAAL